MAKTADGRCQISEARNTMGVVNLQCSCGYRPGLGSPWPSLCIGAGPVALAKAKSQAGTTREEQGGRHRGGLS